ncbi:hypothetical protein BH10BAC3_BH10BAC3_09080 [soil metagenome]
MNISKTLRFRHVIILALAPLVFSCKSSGDKTVKTVDTAITEKHQEHESDHEEAGASALSLNNGAKWQTDESTRTHVSGLMDSLHAFNAKPKADHNAYNAFALSMQREMDSLIKDCKMKGPDHEALHLWLHPVLQDIKDLGSTATADERKGATEKLRSDVEKFNQYFN